MNTNFKYVIAKRTTIGLITYKAWFLCLKYYAFACFFLVGRMLYVDMSSAKNGMRFIAQWINAQ